MKLRRALLALFVLLTAVGCAGSKGKKDGDLAEGQRLPAYFEQIPADTLYFVGGSQPVPKPVVASVMDKLEAFRKISHPGEADANDGSSADGKTRTRKFYMGEAPPENSTEARVLSWLGEQMGGQISADGLKKIGVSPTPRVAIYGVGPVPVIRVELSDKKAFEHFLASAQRASGITLDKQAYQQKPYWRFVEPDGSLTLVRVSDREVVIAMVEQGTRAAFMPYFFGTKKPETSLADDNVFARVAEKNGFEHYGAAYVDVARLISYATGATQPRGISKILFDAADFHMNKSQACKDEYLRIAKMMPRLVAGIRHFDETTTDVALGMELDPEIARQLGEVVSGTPGYETAFAQESLLEIGVGIDTGKMIDFLAARARKIQSQPFQCREFQSLNRIASNTLATSGQVPPAVRELVGFNVLVHRVLLEHKADGSPAGSVTLIPRALAALRTDQPEALMFLVGQFYPPAAQVPAKPDGQPVSIPQAANLYDEIVEPMLLMTTRGLAVTVGPKMAEDTRKVLGAQASATSPAMVARLNLGAPARDLIANVQALVDKAAADRKARGLSEQDIADARAAIAILKDYVPDGPWSATLTAEVNNSGVLFAYRGEGEWPVEKFAEMDDAAEAKFDALSRVLGEDAASQLETMPQEPVRP